MQSFTVSEEFLMLQVIQRHISSSLLFSAIQSIDYICLEFEKKSPLSFKHDEPNIRYYRVKYPRQCTSSRQSTTRQLITLDHIVVS